MKLKKDFITHESDGEQIMVAGSTSVFSGMVRSNRTAAFIVDCLKKETTPEEITDAMAARYDAPRDVIEADVNKIIDKLRSIGAIDGE